MPVRNQHPIRIDHILKNIFFNIEHPYSFSSPYVLWREAKKINANITLKLVKEWLQKQKVYTLYRSVRTRFPRRKVITPGVQYQYQADLVYFQPLYKENNNVKYLLTVIDCFSRFALAIPVKNKEGKEVALALKKAFQSMGFPKKLQTDLGTEFYNPFVKKLLNDLKIDHFSTDQDVKAQIVERFNRTLREKIQKYLISKNSLRYIDALPNILKSYNSRVHSALKTYSPDSVNKTNQHIVHQLQYGEYLSKKGKKHKLVVNDAVRISVVRHTFKKTHHQNFTTEIFYIHKLLFTNPPTYKLRDKNNEVLKGSFYEQELQKV